MKWLLTLLIALDFGERLSYKTMWPTDLALAGIGSLSNIALRGELRMDRNAGPLSEAEWLAQAHNAVLNLQLIDVWAWIFFTLNTTMTMSIIYKILCAISCSTPYLTEGYCLQLIKKTRKRPSRVAPRSSHLQHRHSGHHRVLPRRLDRPGHLCDCEYVLFCTSGRVDLRGPEPV
jgi:hypothetical protein